mgnify:FL=1
MNYTIKHVCTELGLTVHAVRYYCDRGLVPNLRHDAHGNRLIDEESINWLRAVGFLRASGMSIAQIKHYFELCQQGAATLQERQTILAELKQKAEAELAAAQIRVHCLDEKVQSLQESIEGKHPDDCNPMNW